MQAVVAEIISQALLVESMVTELKRTRPRRAHDLVVFKGAIEALMCHAAREYLRGAGPVRLSLSKDILGKGGRYVSPLYTKQLPHILKVLSRPELAFLQITEHVAPTPFAPGKQTRIAAGPRLISRLAEIDVDDIDRRPGQEVVLLKGDRDDRAGIAALVDYEDDEHTNRCRAEVQKLNAFLKSASIEYNGTDPLVDEHERFLVRRFTRANWGCGGRVWGGFWQRLKKADRLANVRIDGQRVVSIDINCAVLRFAYAYVGAQAPAGDLYDSIQFTDASGHPHVFHGNPKVHRRIVKKITAARLNGAREWPSDLREHRPGMPWSRVVACLKAAHPALSSLFDADRGQEVMFTESEVLVDTLLRLQEQDVAALPVHDCIVVSEGTAAIAERAFLDAFQFHTNQAGCVSIERALQE
jgi:hypothetical protein